jgi:hypothetical protein
VALIFGGESHERCEVTVGRVVPQRAGHDQDRISTKVAEDGDAVFSIVEVRSERRSIRWADQARCIEHHAFERSRDRVVCHGRRFPPERGIRRVREQRVEERAELVIVSPAAQHVCKGRRAMIEIDHKPQTAMVW